MIDDPTKEAPAAESGAVAEAAAAPPPVEIPVEVEVPEAPTVPVNVSPAPAAAAAPVAPPEPAKPAGPTPEERIAALEKEKKELHERLLRTAADFDNFRKRSRKDAEDARIKSREDVLREILPVVDNLERALAASDTTGGGGIVEGVKLVLKQFLVALDRFEVKGFNAVGEPFDPARHEAISQIETSAVPPGSIAAELQKGYLIGTKLLRPALVAVAKAPPAPTPPATEAETVAAAAVANAEGEDPNASAPKPAEEVGDG